MGHSLTPSRRTSQRWRPTSAIRIPGIRKTWAVNTRESVRPAMMGPPRIRWTTDSPTNGRAGGDRRPDPEAPVGVLVPAHELAGEGHAERAQEQEHPDDPRHLAWVLVGAPQEDLDHVERHHGDHAVRAPEVHRAQEPPERRLVVQVEQALVRLVGRRDVHEGQADARGDLQDEEGERGAPERVPPARGATRDRDGPSPGSIASSSPARSSTHRPIERQPGHRRVSLYTGPARVGS